MQQVLCGVQKYRMQIFTVCTETRVRLYIKILCTYLNDGYAKHVYKHCSSFSGQFNYILMEKYAQNLFTKRTPEKGVV